MFSSFKQLLLGQLLKNKHSEYLIQNHLSPTKQEMIFDQISVDTLMETPQPPLMDDTTNTATHTQTQKHQQTSSTFMNTQYINCGPWKKPYLRIFIETDLCPPVIWQRSLHHPTMPEMIIITKYLERERDMISYHKKAISFSLSV